MKYESPKAIVIDFENDFVMAAVSTGATTSGTPAGQSDDWA